jgi:hypothetical protein
MALEVNSSISRGLFQTVREQELSRREINRKLDILLVNALMCVVAMENRVIKSTVKENGFSNSAHDSLLQKHSQAFKCENRPPRRPRVCPKNIHRDENASFGTCFSRLFRAINPIIPRKRALSQNPKSAIFISGNVFQTHSRVFF